MADVVVSGDQSNQIDILIASDYYWCVVTGWREWPVALSSHFGWLLSGPANPVPSEHTISTLIIDGCIDAELLDHTDQLSQALCRFWDTEAIGVVDQCNLAHDDFPPELTFDWRGGRYQVGLPWKSNLRPNSTCYSLCVGRLNQLYRCL